MGIKRSYGKDDSGRITSVNYSERRSDGKTETRHYTRHGYKTGKTVKDNRGRSVHYNRYGQRD
jgi:hypothetical protein